MGCCKQVRRALTGTVSVIAHSLFLGFLGSAVFAADPAPEDVVKAAVVFKLTRFVDWPATAFKSSEGSLRICSVGDTPVADALREVEGRTSNGRPIEFLNINSLPEGDRCHLLFVGDYQSKRSSRVASTASAQPILTVSDGEGFAENQGIIELTRRGARLGFRINVSNARRAGLLISAPLLELAEIVE